MAALVMGCTQPPARQGAGVSRAPLRLPAQTARLPRPRVQLASAPAASDYDRDRDRWRVEVPPSAPVRSRPPATRAVRVAGLQPGVGLVPGIGLSSVRYAPPATRPRPAGTLSITQVGLDAAATARDATTDVIDAIGRRLDHGPRPLGITVHLSRGVVHPADSLAAVVGVGRPSIGTGGFGGVDFLPPVRFAWTTGSPYALGEIGLDR